MTTFAQDLYLLVAAYGLAIAVAYAGLPVLGQGAFVAVGAFGTMQLAAHGTPLGIAVITSVVAAGVAGYLVGFAASRLEGAPLALATWGLAWLVYEALLVFPRLSGGSQGLTRETPAHLVSPSLGIVVTLQPWAHALIAGVVVVLIALSLWRAETGPWGLDWAALRTGPALAASLGVPVQRRRRAVIATSAALGALGGAGTALLLGVVAPADYSPLLSLQLFVAVLAGGTARWWGPPIGVAIIAAIPSVADQIAGTGGFDRLRARSVLTAGLLVVVLILRRPAANFLSRLFARFGTTQPPATTSAAGTVTEHRPRHPAVLLELSAVSASYGAVRALDGIDLQLRAGEVHALVGPNGSGKSTALRAAAGVIPVDAGSVRSRDVALTSGPADRVRSGVVRTLQRTSMLGTLPARRQVEVGARAGDRGAFLGLRHLLATPTATQMSDARSRAVDHALRLTGLGERGQLSAAQLDSAEQRMLQIARAVATGAQAVLVDEPAAGMSQPQRRHLAAALRRLAKEGHGVLLVEHDMHLVGKVADRVTVLAEGRVLASGTAAEVRSDPAVAQAYLGQST
jgi:branched-chain amino acid transport system permease protein